MRLHAIDSAKEYKLLPPRNDHSGVAFLFRRYYPLHVRVDRVFTRSRFLPRSRRRPPDSERAGRIPISAVADATGAGTGGSIGAQGVSIDTRVGWHCVTDDAVTGARIAGTGVASVIAECINYYLLLNQTSSL